MQVLVTGGEGWIGRYVVQELLDRGMEPVLLISGKSSREKKFQQCRYISKYINDNDISFLDQINGIEKMIHLAWDGSNDFSNEKHYEEYLWNHYQFLKLCVQNGINDLTIIGSCLEYGMIEGELCANLNTNPVCAYGIAKDTLRKFLQQLKSKHLFNLKWIRLFYLFGPGQAKSTLLGSLEEALKSESSVFNMSPGDQLRDYLDVRVAAKKIVDRCLNSSNSEIINCCSGKPISVEQFVRDYIKEKSASIELNLSFYPYKWYEPKAFWGKNDCY